METMTKSCETCLYMATHENCDGCLHEKNDYKDFNEAGGWKLPPYRYANYQEGNWMKRIMHFELNGLRNIVIGGQGEAEVNTKWTPEKTSKHLHYVSKQCGYITGTLQIFGKKTAETTKTLKISTPEGNYMLIWLNDKLNRIAQLDYEGQIKNDFWNREQNQTLIAGMTD